jgi:hypothetical protein
VQGGDHKTFWDWLFNRRGRDEGGRPSTPQEQHDDGDGGGDTN